MVLFPLFIWGIFLGILSSLVRFLCPNHFKIEFSFFHFFFIFNILLVPRTFLFPCMSSQFPPHISTSFLILYIHRFLGLPLGSFPSIFMCSIFLGILSSLIRITCPNHFKTEFSFFIFFSNLQYVAGSKKFPVSLNVFPIFLSHFDILSNMIYPYVSGSSSWSYSLYLYVQHFLGILSSLIRLSCPNHFKIECSLFHFNFFVVLNILLV